MSGNETKSADFMLMRNYDVMRPEIDMWLTPKLKCQFCPQKYRSFHQTCFKSNLAKFG